MVVVVVDVVVVVVVVVIMLLSLGLITQGSPSAGQIFCFCPQTVVWEMCTQMAVVGPEMMDLDAG